MKLNIEINNFDVSKIEVLIVKDNDNLKEIQFLKVSKIVLNNILNSI